MSQYIFLKVKEIIKETTDAITIVFNKPTTNTSYKPGQFLSFIFEVGGEKLRRSYSLSSSPYTDEHWAVSVKKVKGGKMSTHLVDHLKVGDIIETMAPAGIFTYEPSPVNNADIVLIGAGSGITPLFSILNSALSVEKDSRVFLLYANRNEESVILKKAIEALELKYTERFFYTPIYSQPIEDKAHMLSGRMDQDKVKQLLEGFKVIDFSNALFFVCGPQGMMDESFQALELLKVPQDHIRKESFVSSSSGTEQKVIENPGTGVVVGIRYNKHEYKVNVAPGQTILEAALNQDIDLPYSCQSGMCTACMGRCKNGQIKMDDPDGLSENEIKQGYVLTCVGRPLTTDVLIEID
ncbi:MAG TPA: ferredoxin--NADP reductase [Cytophagaceae bacterium]|nr:ferredoxin--NADP reductase [Cytophagaceae bacterium]